MAIKIWGVSCFYLSSTEVTHLCLCTWLFLWVLGIRLRSPCLHSEPLKTESSPQSPSAWISKPSVASSALFLPHGSPLCSHIGHTYRHTYAWSPFTDTVDFFDALCLHLLLQGDCNSLCLWWKCAPVCGEALHCLISKRVGDSTLGVVREKERRLASGNGINGKWSEAFKTIFSCLTLILPPHASLIILWAEENCVDMIRGSFTRGSEKVRLFSIRLWVAEVCSLEWYEILRKKEKYLWAKSTSKCQGDYPKKCKEALECVILGQASI